jgi:hypothetical protein
VIRETYPNLEKNTLPSWFRIHPESDGKFTWKAPSRIAATDPPHDPRNGQGVDVCDFEIEFRAIGDRSVEEACRGWEVVAVMIDEADLQPPELLAFLSGRVGDHRTLTLPWLSTHDHHGAECALYRQLDVRHRLRERISGACSIRLGRGAGWAAIGRNIHPAWRPDAMAENLHNLPKGYYTIQAALNKHRPDYVARMIDNKPVPMQHGQPVNPQFDFERHVQPWNGTGTAC